MATYKLSKKLMHFEWHEKRCTKSNFNFLRLIGEGKNKAYSEYKLYLILNLICIIFWKRFRQNKNLKNDQLPKTIFLDYIMTESCKNLKFQTQTSWLEEYSTPPPLPVL